MSKARPSDLPGGLMLVVLGGKASGVHPLPERGRVTIGRAPECDVVIDDPSVSRQHAVLEIGRVLELEDLGSANGTRVRAALSADGSDETEKSSTEEHRLTPRERVQLALGAVMQLGSALAMVQPRSASQPAGRVVVQSPAMKELHRMAEKAAATDVTVLVLGETGAGKGVVAARIHDASPRARFPLVALNSAALPETLLESELFGHEKGSFTGATEARAGLLESAHRGTVFLDEVAELSLGIQAKLLSVLESRQVLRVGAREPRNIDVRFVMATNKDLEEEVRAGRFREDLFFRINVFSLVVPPLRERSDEILPLARLFVEEMSARMASASFELSAAAEQALLRYDWPGNVRELRNVIERAIVLCNGNVIDERHLPLDRMARAAAPPRRSRPAAPVAQDDLRASVRDLERQRILEALEQCAGNQTRAAELLGISRRMLVKRLEAYGLPRPRKQVR